MKNISALVLTVILLLSPSLALAHGIDGSIVLTGLGFLLSPVFIMAGIVWKKKGFTLFSFFIFAQFILYFLEVLLHSIIYEFFRNVVGLDEPAFPFLMILSIQYVSYLIANILLTRYLCKTSAEIKNEIPPRI